MTFWKLKCAIGLQLPLYNGENLCLVQRICSTQHSKYTTPCFESALPIKSKTKREGRERESGNVTGAHVYTTSAGSIKQFCRSGIILVFTRSPLLPRQRRQIHRQRGSPRGQQPPLPLLPPPWACSIPTPSLSGWRTQEISIHIQKTSQLISAQQQMQLDGWNILSKQK